MTNKSSKKKLVLGRETVRNLDAKVLATVVGGDDMRPASRLTCDMTVCTSTDGRCNDC